VLTLHALISTNHSWLWFMEIRARRVSTS